MSEALGLDLHAQWAELEHSGQFRFTPPTHCLLALHEALRLLKEEGGISARHNRYQDRHRQLLHGMQTLGFEPLVAANKRSPIITAFSLARLVYAFDDLYKLAAQNLLVTGKFADVDGFRIGNIGHLHAADIERLLHQMRHLALKNAGWLSKNKLLPAEYPEAPCGRHFSRIFRS